jgi:hypothetical protein
MFQEQRAYALLRMQACQAECDNWEAQIDRLKTGIAWSAVFQRIGLEAALTAVTMGGARAAAAGLNHAFGRWAAARVLQGGAAGRTLDLMAKVGRAAETPLGGAVLSATVAEAAANTAGRMIAVLVIQTPIRGAAGDLTWQGLGLSLIGSLAGIPGNAVTPTAARFSEKLSFLVKAGSVISYQNLTITTTTLAKAYNDAMAEGESLDAFLGSVKASLKNSGKPIGAVIVANAEAIAATASQTASSNEPMISRTARVAANRVNYNAMLPFMARNFSDIDEEMRYAYVEYADAYARYRLWYNLLQFLNNLERATLAVQNRAGQ